MFFGKKKYNWFSSTENQQLNPAFPYSYSKGKLDESSLGGVILYMRIRPMTSSARPLNCFFLPTKRPPTIYFQHAISNLFKKPLRPHTTFNHNRRYFSQSIVPTPRSNTMKKAEKIGLYLLISGALLTSVGLYAHENQSCSVKSSKLILSPVETTQCVEQHVVADSNVRKTEEGLVTLQKTHLQTFQGSETVPYADALARLSNTIYKEYPYLYGIEDTAEFYLTKFCHSSEVKLCLLFDDQTIVGYAIGVPLKAYSSSFQQPFITAQLDREKFFYLGELALLPRYRKQGFGKQMLSEMENMVKKDNKYPNICLVHIDESTLLDKKPADYISGVTFWSHMGYKCCPEISFTAEWENTGETTTSSHTLIYWIKPL